MFLLVVGRKQRYIFHVDTRYFLESSSVFCLLCRACPCAGCAFLLLLFCFRGQAENIVQDKHLYILTHLPTTALYSLVNSCFLYVLMCILCIYVRICFRVFLSSFGAQGFVGLYLLLLPRCAFCWLGYCVRVYIYIIVCVVCCRIWCIV